MIRGQFRDAVANIVVEGTDGTTEGKTGHTVTKPINVGRKLVVLVQSLSTTSASRSQPQGLLNR